MPKFSEKNHFSPSDRGLACSDREAIAPLALPWCHPCVLLAMLIAIVFHNALTQYFKQFSWPYGRQNLPTCSMPMPKVLCLYYADGSPLEGLLVIE